MSNLVESGKASITPVGATFLPGIPYKEMERFVASMAQVRRFSIAALGDALNYAEMEYGESYAQLEAVTGLDPSYLYNLKWVFGSVPIDNRVEGLGVSFLQVVAPLPVEDQREWLEKALCLGWTRNELREAVKGPSKEKEQVLSLRCLVQELLWAWDKGKDIEEWISELRKIVSS